MKLSNRKIAISWAMSSLRKNNVLILDTETTGFGKNDKIVDLGVIDNRGNIVINLLLQPNIPMPSDATKVNGITDNMLKGCPNFAQVSTTIRKILTGKIIIAWNSSFDKRMVDNEFKRLGEEPPIYTWEDEMPMYKQYADNAKSNKLCIAAKECGIVEEQIHRAVGDCQFTLEVLKYMANN